MTEKERQRLEDLWRFDMEKGQGRPVYGMDEVGRGPLAGPVVAACVWMPETWIEGVKDSKKIAEKKRERIAEQIKDKALAYGIGLADVAEIERLNILNATKLAMQRAYEQMPKRGKGRRAKLCHCRRFDFGEGNTRCTDEGLRNGLSGIWMGTK